MRKASHDVTPSLPPGIWRTELLARPSKAKTFLLPRRIEAQSDGFTLQLAFSVSQSLTQIVPPGFVIRPFCPGLSRALAAPAPPASAFSDSRRPLNAGIGVASLFLKNHTLRLAQTLLPMW